MLNTQMMMVVSTATMIVTIPIMHVENKKIQEIKSTFSYFVSQTEALEGVLGKIK
jgi:hypothetical protein